MARAKYKGAIMKTRGIFTLVLVMIITLVVGMTLTACNTEETEVTRVSLETNEIFLAPEGEPAQYQLKPIVYPTTAKNQTVNYKLVEAGDHEFLEVSTTGLVTAKKMKVDEEGNPIPMYIRLMSADNPKATYELKVIVESVPVERLYFNPDKIEVELNGGAVQVKPIFEPYHAIIGRNVKYKVDNKDVLSVDSYGYITPKNVGTTMVWAETPTGAEIEKPIVSGVMVTVRYAPLNYKLVVNNPTSLKQIYGEPEAIGLALNMLDENSDPNPSVDWFVNNSPINEVGFKDNQTVSYTPSLPKGDYKIRAVLTNSNQRLELESETLHIYNPLSAISADVINEKDEFSVGDTVYVKVSNKADEYPPESFNWKITLPDGNKVTMYKESASSAGGVTDLYYTFEKPGQYEFVAEAIVKGKATGTLSNVIKVSVDDVSLGNDLNNLYVEALKVNDNYLPFISLAGLPYMSEFSVEIREGDDGDYSYATITSEDDEEYFVNNGVYIPSEIVELTDSFSVRVKSGGYGWTEWIDYNGDILSEREKYFDTLIGEHNTYISNMEDLGKLLNYIVIYRPESIKVDEMVGGNLVEDIYKMTLYVPFLYEDLPFSVYHLEETDEPREENATNLSYVNIFKIVVSAMRTYVETAHFSFYYFEGMLGGECTVGIKLHTDLEPTESTSNDAYNYGEGNYVVHFGNGSRANDSTLPIDKVTRTREVSTTNQLMLALNEGYKPLPTAGSRAEEIYKIIRAVLIDICDDNMTEAEKAHAIYDWLTVNVKYDYALANRNPSLDDAPNTAFDGFYLEGVFKADFLPDGSIAQIKRGKAVCDGIAKAFNVLCNVEGLRAYKITGKTTGENGVGHAWNEVLVEGNWYLVDATWGNELRLTYDVELETHRYLLASDAQIRTTRETYGLYPETAKESYDIGYMTKVEHTKGYDTLINSDEELTYVVGTYMFAKIGTANDLWIDVKLAEDYLYALYEASGYEGTYNHYCENNLFASHYAGVLGAIESTFEGFNLTIVPSTNTHLQIRLWRN